MGGYRDAPGAYPVQDAAPSFGPFRPIVAAVLVLGGAALIAAVAFGVPPGLRTLARWWLAMAGLAGMVAGLGVWRGAALAGLLAAALILGGAAQLYVTQPLWYPELRLPPRSTMELVMFLIVGAQGALAIAVLALRTRRAAWRRAVGAFGAVRLGVFVALGGAFTVSILNYLRLDEMQRYGPQLVAGTVLIVVNLANVIAVAATLPSGIRLPQGPRLAACLAAGFLAITLLLSWFAFERVMHVQDELAYIFQARTYAGGALYVPALPEAAREAFGHYLLDTHDGRWISVFTPGWPAVLALGVLAGVPWLVNPLLGAVTILIGHDLLRRLWGPRLAAVGALLMASSPWLIAMSATLMAHTLALFLTVSAWWLILRAETASPRLAAGLTFAAGLALGWLFLTRNLDGLVIGVATGIFLLTRGPLRQQIGRAASYSLGCIATGGLIFVYNIFFTGDALLTTLSAYYKRTWPEGANRFGFGEGIGPPEGWGHMELVVREHSPFEALVNTLNNINALHIDYLGWGIGSLALVWAFLIWGRRDRIDIAMLVAIAVIVLPHAFYWFAASFYVGPRYWFMVFFPLVLLSVRGVETVGTRLTAAGLDADGRRLTAGVVLLCLFATTVFLSYRGVTRYHEHRAYDDHYRGLVPMAAAGEAAPLVLFTPRRQKSSAFFFNDPWFPANRPVFAEDLGPASNAAVIAAFPDRPVLYYDEASRTFRTP